MRDPYGGVTLLSKAQLDLFRSQLQSSREARFVAPQLLEHAAIIDRQLRSALDRLERLEVLLRDLEARCPDEALRDALRRLRNVAG